MQLYISTIGTFESICIPVMFSGKRLHHIAAYIFGGLSTGESICRKHIYIAVTPLAVSALIILIVLAFWTGKNFVAVELDGSSHVGKERHITRDRMLQRAGVQVIHILNSEVLNHGDKVIERLLPIEITKYWNFKKRDAFDLRIPF